jgi:hypothetical protein
MIEPDLWYDGLFDRPNALTEPATENGRGIISQRGYGILAFKVSNTEIQVPDPVESDAPKPNINVGYDDGVPTGSSAANVTTIKIYSLSSGEHYETIISEGMASLASVENEGKWKVAEWKTSRAKNSGVVAGLNPTGTKWDDRTISVVRGITSGTEEAVVSIPNNGTLYVHLISEEPEQHTKNPAVPDGSEHQAPPPTGPIEIMEDPGYNPITIIKVYDKFEDDVIESSTVYTKADAARAVTIDGEIGWSVDDWKTTDRAIGGVVSGSTSAWDNVEAVDGVQAGSGSGSVYLRNPGENYLYVHLVTNNNIDDNGLLLRESQVTRQIESDVGVFGISNQL